MRARLLLLAALLSCLVAWGPAAWAAPAPAAPELAPGDWAVGTAHPAVAGACEGVSAAGLDGRLGRAWVVPMGGSRVAVDLEGVVLEGHLHGGRLLVAGHRPGALPGARTSLDARLDGGAHLVGALSLVVPQDAGTCTLTADLEARALGPAPAGSAAPAAAPAPGPAPALRPSGAGAPPVPPARVGGP